MNRGLGWIGLILLDLLVVGVVFGIAELLTRRLLALNNPFEVRSSYNLAYRPSAFSRHTLKPEQEVFALAADGRVQLDRRRFRIDRHGFRTDDEEELSFDKPPGEVRIVFLGGSHVFDLHCVDADGCPGYPALIGQRLRAEGWPVRVINAGMPGQDSRSFAARLGLELHRFAPDYVVFASVWNDLKWMSRLDREQRMLDAPLSKTDNPLVEADAAIDRWLGWSALYRTIRDRWWIWRRGLEARGVEGRARSPAPAAVDRERAREQYRINFAAAAAVARQIGAQPVLALEGRLVAADNSAEEIGRISMHLIPVDSHARLVRDFAVCDAELKRLSAAEALPLIDLRSELAPRRAELFSDHVHTTPAGSRALAAAYARELGSILGSPGAQDGSPPS